MTKKLRSKSNYYKKPRGKNGYPKKPRGKNNYSKTKQSHEDTVQIVQVIPPKVEPYRPKIVYWPKNPRQELVREYWEHSKFMILSGEAGTGKTTAALGEALLDIVRGISKKIYLSRPAVEAGERLGFLPGDLKEKFKPWMSAFEDVLGDISDGSLDKLSEFVEMIPIGMLRGRTLKHGTLIIDEAQNCQFAQLVLAGSRCGTGGRVVLCGDTDQSDIDWRGGVPLSDVARRSRVLKNAKWINFLKEDQMRDPFVTEFLEAMSSNQA